MTNPILDKYGITLEDESKISDISLKYKPEDPFDRIPEGRLLEPSPKSKVLSSLKSHFSSPSAISGIMANIDIETGGTYDHLQKQGGDGPGRGLFQMEGGMLKAYQKNLKDNSLIDSTNNQILFMKNALDSGDIYDIGAGNRIKIKKALESDNPETATEVFMQRFERPGTPHTERRKESSLKLYKDITSEDFKPKVPKPQSSLFDFIMPSAEASTREQQSSKPGFFQTWGKALKHSLLHPFTPMPEEIHRDMAIASEPESIEREENNFEQWSREGFPMAISDEGAQKVVDLVPKGTKERRQKVKEWFGDMSEKHPFWFKPVYTSDFDDNSTTRGMEFVKTVGFLSMIGIMGAESIANLSTAIQMRGEHAQMSNIISNIPKIENLLRSRGIVLKGNLSPLEKIRRWASMKDQGILRLLKEASRVATPYTKTPKPPRPITASFRPAQTPLPYVVGQMIKYGDTVGKIVEISSKGAMIITAGGTQIPVAIDQLKAIEPPDKAPTQPVEGELSIEPSKDAVSKPEVAKKPIVEPLTTQAKKFKTAEEWIGFMHGSATQYRDYNPQLRAKYKLFEDSARISELGIDPEKEITIYRGVSDAKTQKIVDGDFVTVDRLSAESYAGKEYVVSKKVKAKDLIADSASEFDKDRPFELGAEFTYSDSKNKLSFLSDTQLTDIWTKAQEKPETKLEQAKDEGKIDIGTEVLQSPEKYGINEEQLRLFPKTETEVSHGSEAKSEENTKEVVKDLQRVRGIRPTGPIHPTEVSKIVKEIESRGFIDYRGLEVNGFDDIAELAAAYRHPKIEQFQIFYLKDNKVLAHRVISSGAGNFVYFPSKNAQRVKKVAQNLEADAIYFAHNHPSGNPKPSLQDIGITNYWNKDTNGLVKGHIVTNGKSYYSIETTNGKSEATEKIFYEEKADYRRGLPSASNFETIAKEVKKTFNGEKASVVFLDSQNNVLSIDNISLGKDYASFMEENIRRHKANKVILSLPTTEPVPAMQFPPETVDVIMINPKTGLSSSVIGSVRVKFPPPEKKITYGVKEKPKPYRVARTIGGIVNQRGGISLKGAYAAGWSKTDVRTLRSYIKAGGQSPDALAEQMSEELMIPEGQNPSEALKEALMSKQPTIAELEKPSPEFKLGFKEGWKQAKNKMYLKAKSVKTSTAEFKKYLSDYIKKHLSLEDRGKLLTKMRDVHTKKGVVNAIELIDKIWEKGIRKDAINNLKKTIKGLDISKLSPQEAEPVKTILKDLDLVEHRKQTFLKLNKTKEYLEKTPNAEMPEYVLERLSVLNNKDINTFSAGDLEDIQNSIAHYVHLNKVKNQIKVDREQRRTSEVLESSISEMKSPTKVKSGIVQSQKSKVGKLKKTGQLIVDTFGIRHDHYDLVIESLSGPNSTMDKVLYQGVKEGILTELKYKQEVYKTFHNDIDIETFQRKFNVKDIGTWQNEKVLTKGLNFTRGERMALYRHSLNEDNRRAILEGGYGLKQSDTPHKIHKMSEETLNAILENLTPAEKAFAGKPVANLFENQGKSLGKVFYDKNGYPLPLIDNYYPKEVMRISLGEKQETESVLEELKHKWVRVGLSKGMLKSRVKSKLPIYLNSLAYDINKSVTHAAAYVGLEIPLSNASKLVYDKKFKANLVSRYGLQTWREIEKGIRDIAGDYLSYSTVEELALKMKNKLSTAYLGLSPFVMAKQILSYPLYNLYVKPQYLIQGYADYVMDLKGTVGRHRMYSPEFAERIEGGYSRDVADVFKSGAEKRLYKGKTTVSEKLMGGIKLLDLAAVIPGTQGAVLQVLDEINIGKFSPEVRTALDTTATKAQDLNVEDKLKLAYKFADYVTERTQPMFSPEHRSSLSRGTPIEKLATQFSSFTNQALNLIRRTYRESRRTGDPKMYAKVAKVLFYLLVVNTGGVFVIDEIRNRLYKRKKKTYGEAVLDSVASYFYFLRDLEKSVVSKVKRGTWGGFDISLPVLSFSNVVGDAIASGFRMIMEKGEKKKKEATKFIDKTLETVLTTGGFPYRTPKQLLEIPFKKEKKKPSIRENPILKKYNIKGSTKKNPILEKYGL